MGWTLYTFYTQDGESAGQTTNTAEALQYKATHPDYAMEESTSDKQVSALPKQVQ